MTDRQRGLNTSEKNNVPLPERGIRYTDNQGETFEVVGRGESIGLTYWWELKNIRTGQKIEATFSQIKDAVTNSNKPI